MLAETDVKTDAQIYLDATKEWLGVLSQLWIAFDKPLDTERLTIYRNMLEGIPLGLLEPAIKRVIRDHKFNNVPTIADVWAAVRKELGNPIDIDRAITIWCESLWNRAVMLNSEAGE